MYKFIKMLQPNDVVKSKTTDFNLTLIGQNSPIHRQDLASNYIVEDTRGNQTNLAFHEWECTGSTVTLLILEDTSKNFFYFELQEPTEINQPVNIEDEFVKSLVINGFRLCLKTLSYAECEEITQVLLQDFQKFRQEQVNKLEAERENISLKLNNLQQ